MPPTHLALTWLLLLLLLLFVCLFVCFRFVFFFFFFFCGLWCGGGCGCVGRLTSMGGWVRWHQWVAQVGFVVVGVGVAIDQP